MGSIIGDESNHKGKFNYIIHIILWQSLHVIPHCILTDLCKEFINPSIPLCCLIFKELVEWQRKSMHYLPLYTYNVISKDNNFIVCSHDMLFESLLNIPCWNSWWLV
ncbi:hypothetical protein CHS0354_027464 [Potamilus streckersoni]|uniref:Uncharacterized protein n=1 Tax=Potamilus streckersoni TaxID=2493646 RepID=A0AAE0T6E9_9BIVA|nr:hypothetical protein CHS0354_027464 [Potamilus streckersoni]